MRIAINASILDDRPSGLGVYTYNVIKELINLIDNDSGDILYIYTSVPNYFEKRKNIIIKKIPEAVQPIHGKSAAIKRFKWVQYNLLKDMKKEGIELLYSTTHHGSIFCKNQIVTVHDLAPLYFNYRDSLQRMLQVKYFKTILPLILKKAKKIIAISENTKKDIIKFYNIDENKVVRIYNGYDQNVFYPRYNAYEYMLQKYKINSDYILAVGASNSNKNYESLLYAMNLIKNKNIALLIIGGKKEYKDALKNLAKRLKIENKICFFDYISQEDLPYFYSAAKCLVYPSLYEGFGLPPLEAMACGCPVITSNVSSLPEVIGEAGIMVNPYSFEEIARAIDLVVSNENLRTEMIRKGFEQAKKFSWTKTAEEIYKTIKETVYYE